MAKSFQVELERRGNTGTIFLKGVLNEDANLLSVDLNGLDELRINLEQLEGINSCGIREWVQWVSKLVKVPKVYLDKCPKVFIDQVNMVNGFLPAHSKILSFYVPYYSESSNEEYRMLYQYGEHFTDDGVIDLPEIKHPNSQKVFELDVLPNKYFKFIKAS